MSGYILKKFLVVPIVCVISLKCDKSLLRAGINDFPKIIEILLIKKIVSRD